MFTEILATWKSYCVATYTFDREISCHPMHIVAETAMTTYLLHFIMPTAWQQPYCVHKNSCHMENIFVATDTVDQEISCHPVQIVTETIMSTFILHFEIQLPRSRVHWQLS